MQTMSVDYDSRFDTLYVGLGDKSNSYGDDEQDDIIFMRDMDTDEITGFTILSFLKKHTLSALPKLPQYLNISFEKDILPIIKR